MARGPRNRHIYHRHPRLPRRSGPWQNKGNRRSPARRARYFTRDLLRFGALIILVAGAALFSDRINIIWPDPPSFLRSASIDQEPGRLPMPNHRSPVGITSIGKNRLSQKSSAEDSQSLVG